MQQINPQSIIDELTKRLQQAVLENVVLSARIRELTEGVEPSPIHNDSETTVVIGDSTQE